MTEVTEDDLGADFWATSEDVQDDVQLEIQNEEADHERRIEQATRRVQSWYQDAAAEDPPDDPPALLRDATSLLAASLVHQAYAQNISGENDGDERHVFLEDSARDFFDDWKTAEELDAGDDTDGSAGDQVGGRTGIIGGSDRSPIHRGDY